MEKIQVIEGGLSIDDRGQLTFANGFNFSNVKRFYLVENFCTNTIRAFHGHKNEGKYVFVVQGEIILSAVVMDDPIHPNTKNTVQRWILSSKKPTIIFIPPGYANGFRSLTNETKVMFFSTSTLEESKGDDFRFPADYWGSQVWSVENR